MNIEAKPHPAEPGITLLTLSGRLDTPTEALIAAQVLKVAEDCDSGLLVDLAQVDFISSAGLRLFVQVCKHLSAKGKKLAMVQAQPAIYKLFKLAGMEEIFHLFQNDQAAIEAIWRKS